MVADLEVVSEATGLYTAMASRPRSFWFPCSGWTSKMPKAVLGSTANTCWTLPSIFALPARSPLARATWGSWLTRRARAGSTPPVPPAPESMLKPPVKDRS
jgi:hypothetical protein